jgi:hypothetical protein
MNAMATEQVFYMGKQIALDVDPVDRRFRWSFAIDGGPLHVSRDEPMPSRNAMRGEGLMRAMRVIDIGGK